MSEVYEKLMKCYKSVREKTDFVPEAALILGSGLGVMGKKTDIRYKMTIDQLRGYRRFSGIHGERT